jgi:hypothetical protein
MDSLKAELSGAQGRSAETGGLEEELKNKDQLIRELGNRIIEAKEASMAEREGLLSRVHELEKDRMGLYDKILDLDREKQEFKERMREMEDNLNEAAKMLYISKQLEAELEKELATLRLGEGPAPEQAENVQDKEQPAPAQSSEQAPQPAAQAEPVQQAQPVQQQEAAPPPGAEGTPGPDTTEAQAAELPVIELVVAEPPAEDPDKPKENE